MFDSRRGLRLAFILSLCLFPSVAGAQTVTLAWDRSTDTSVSGYMVRWGGGAGVYPNSIDAGNVTSKVLASLTPGNTYFAVVEAYTATGEYSDPSNMLTFTVPAISCAASVTPTSINVLATTTSGSLSVTVTAPSCRWGATTSSAFFSFQAASSRSGSGSLAYSLDRNYSTLIRTGTGTVAGLPFTFTQQGAAVNPAAVARETARSDFNGDGYSDILWQDTKNGYVASWLLTGSHVTRTPIGASHMVADRNWQIAGSDDFNGDGKPDILWHHRTSGALYVWFMDGMNRIGHSGFSAYGITDARWKVVGIGDFNSDRKPDIVWQHETAGWLAVWLLDGTTLIRGVDLNPIRVLDTRWRIEGVADFNADGHSDLLFRHGQTGELALWVMNATTRASYQQLTPAAITDKEWRIASLLDMNDDQTPDIVWQHETTGWLAVWYMNGTKRITVEAFPVMVETNWRIVGSR
jgi:hypothetical protein